MGSGVAVFVGLAVLVAVLVTLIGVTVGDEVLVAVQVGMCVGGSVAVAILVGAMVMLGSGSTPGFLLPISRPTNTHKSRPTMMIISLMGSHPAISGTPA